jgi:hypothetical protein
VCPVDEPTAKIAKEEGQKGQVKEKNHIAVWHHR